MENALLFSNLVRKRDGVGRHIIDIDDFFFLCSIDLLLFDRFACAISLLISALVLILYFAYDDS